MATNRNFCDLCNISIEEDNQEAHTQGKTHQLSLHKLHIWKQREKSGIYVTGLPYNIDEKELINYFATYGKIVEHFCEERNRFLIVQYNDSDVAQNVLKKTHTLMGRTLIVKPRIFKEKEKMHNNFEIEGQTENFESINASLKNIDNFDEQVRQLLSCIQPDWLVMKEKYKRLCEDLESVLKLVFPNCIVYPFGSTITGLSFNSSDVDVYVKIFSNHEQDQKVSTLINKSRKVLGRSRLFYKIVGIPKAKTPIVKCVHVPTNISCDFNFKNMLGVCNSHLIRYYLSLDSKLTPCMMILKYWAKVHEISGGQKFSNYSLVMLLIFYLQQELFNFPSVLSLQKSPDCLNLQEGWNGGFLPDENFNSSAIENYKLEGLLESFFNFYVNFNFTMDIVCPYTGKIAKKVDFLKPENLPDYYDRYKQNIVNSGSLKVETAICIQDPFEHSRNTAAGVASKCLEEFTLLCSLGAEIFNSKNTENSLYKLFTEEPNVSSLQRCVFSNNKCTFRITMGNCLKYLEKKVEENSTDLMQNMVKVWFDTVNQFVYTVLVSILKFDMIFAKDEASGKFQKLDGQSDVHDTNIADSVIFQCSSKVNLWETRKSIAKDLRLSFPPNSTVIDKEIALTNYICNELYKNVTFTECIIKFNLTLNAKTNPNEMEFHLDNIDSYKGNFKTASKFFATKLPHWFGIYERELNKAVVKEQEDLKTDNTDGEHNKNV